jgi:uncharacterized membrane protein
MGLLVLSLIGLAVFALAKRAKGGSDGKGSAKERGLEILTERFALGEIDAETFRSMRSEFDNEA